VNRTNLTLNNSRPIIFTCVSYAEARNRYRLDVCLSVRLSHAGTVLKRLNMLSCFLHHTNCSFVCIKIFAKFRRSHPCGGDKYRWGIKIARFSTNKSLYLANDTWYRHGCYGRRIGTHTRSIKWCHFQWSWMNPNTVFKVRPFFDAEYLQNDCSIRS